MGNTSTKESPPKVSVQAYDVRGKLETPAVPFQRYHSVSGCHVSTTGHSSVVVTSSYSSSPTVSKGSSTLVTSRPYIASNYAPSAPKASNSSGLVDHVVPGTSHDPFHFGPPSRRITTPNSTRHDQQAGANNEIRPKTSPIRKQAPVILWDNNTQRYTTVSTATKTGVSSSFVTAGASTSAAVRTNSTNSSSVKTTSSVGNNNVPLSSKPCVPVAPAVSSSSRAMFINGSTQPTRSNLPIRQPPPSTSRFPDGITSTPGVNGAQTRFHRAQTSPAVQVYTPLNIATPNFTAPDNNSDAPQPSAERTNEFNRGNRARGGFIRGRGRNRGGNNNQGDFVGNNQGNNNGRGRGRGQNRRGNNNSYRGGHINNNNNHNNQDLPRDSSTDRYRENDAQEPYENSNFSQPPNVSGNNNTEEVDVNHRGRGRVFTRGRGKGNNARRGQGRRNRGGGPGIETNRDPNTAGGSGSKIATDSSSLSAHDLEYNQFECPICMEALLPPIYQCHNGHMVCNSCESQIRQCPICREEMPAKKIRNLPIEQIVRGSD